MTAPSRTKPDAWTIGELADALSDHPQSGRRIQLPRFQRTVVWSERQRQGLINSLRAGHPIGSLLLFEVPSTDEEKTYLLVDGLQRMTAVKDYLESPLAYLTENGLSETVVDKLTSVLATDPSAPAVDDAFTKAVIKWMKSTKDLKSANGFTAHNLVNNVMEELGLQPDVAELGPMYDAASPILDLIKDEVDIASIALPVLLFSGRADELPDIFEKLNSAGTVLSKYDIYAATWVDQETVITNQAIKDAVDMKYQALIDEGYEVAGLDSGSFSLFEYLFGLGKILSAEYPLLFGRSDPSASPEAAAFTLMTVAYQLEIPRMKELPAKVRTDAAAPINPEDFEIALMSAVQTVSDVLGPAIGLKLNEKDGASLVVHTQFQIASLICRVLAATHTPFTWEPRAEADEELEVLRTTIRAHYLYDLLLGTWRSAGDTRVFARTWLKDDEGGVRPSQHYLMRLSPHDVDQALELWFREQLQRNQKSRGSVRGLDKLFLKLVYNDVVTFADHVEKSFELEHLFPVSRLAQIVADEPEGWPISAVSNLALFETRLNREKSKKTISEYIDGISDPGTKHARMEEMNRYLLVPIDDVAIPQDEHGGDVLVRDEYEDFLRGRFNVMKQLAMHALGYA